MKGRTSSTLSRTKYVKCFRVETSCYRVVLRLNHGFDWNSSWLWNYVSVKSKLQHAPPGHTPGIWHLCRPGEEGIWWSESSRGWGIWSPCFRGGEFELHPRFHVMWWAIMGDAVLEDFRGKDCAFVANWLRGKGLNKLCAVFEVFKF